MKILLSVDGSEYTRRMLEYIAAHDELLGAGHQYTAYTVVTGVPHHAARFIPQETLNEYYTEQAEVVFKSVRAFAEQQKWDVRTIHAHGHAPECIARFANSEKFDLIVMGTHGHSPLGNVVLGSVVTGVLARCTTPVLLVR